MAATRKYGFFATAMLLGSLAAVPAFGQAAPPDNGGGGAGQPGGGGGPGGGGPGGGGGGGFQQFRQRMMDRMKQQLGTSDDEFAALQPKIEKVMQLQRDANGGRGFGGRGGWGRGPGGGGGPGGPGGFGGGNNQPQSDVQVKLKDLQDTLDNKDATPGDIKSKLDALRDARAKAKEELAAAQKDLKDLLTQRQEAVLVEMGMLE